MAGETSRYRAVLLVSRPRRRLWGDCLPLQGGLFQWEVVGSLRALVRAVDAGGLDLVLAQVPWIGGDPLSDLVPPDAPVARVALLADEPSAELPPGADAALSIAELSTRLGTELLCGVIEQARLQQALRRRVAQVALSEARLRALVDLHTDGLVLIDETGVVLYVNPAGAALLGRREVDLVGSKLGFPVVGGAITEVDLLRPDGAPVPAELRVTESTWDGRTVQLVALRDITRQRLDQDLLRRQAAALAAAAEAILVTATGGRVVELNPAAARLFGLPRERLLGRQFSELLPTAQVGAVLAALRSGHGWAGLVSWPRPGQPPLAVRLSISPLTPAEGAEGSCVVIVHDLGDSGSSFASAAPPAPPGPTARALLVVDDEAAVRHSLARLLRHQGYEVLLAANGAEAQEVVRREGARLGLVLTDLLMPLLDGAALVRWLRSEHPQLPVLLMSGYPDAWQRDPALQAMPLLRKPFDEAALLRAVTAAWRGDPSPATPPTASRPSSEPPS
ncbi:MAG: PAS domain-containing protein [Fimbriimonadaceae bacterium]|nr:PAS domain-containing protein [Fimbriimonadaceae bacterium]